MFIDPRSLNKPRRCESIGNDEDFFAEAKHIGTDGSRTSKFVGWDGSMAGPLPLHIFINPTVARGKQHRS